MNAVWLRNIAVTIEVIKPMLDLGADSRRIANTLNKQGVFTPKSGSLWNANTISRFCSQYAKKLDLDDGESLFQTQKRPSEIEDFFPYPNYGPMP